MKRIIYILILAAGVFVTKDTKAQTIGEFGYQISFPTGDFGDFIKKTSFVGFTGGARATLSNKRLSVGGNGCWFYFPDKRGVETADLKEGGTITGYFTNYTNIYGLYAVGQYDLKDNKEMVVPFLRLGVGGAYQNQRQDVGLYSFQSDGVQFLLNGEAGVRLSKDGMRGITLAATYYWLPEASDMVSTSFFGIKLGIANSKY